MKPGRLILLPALLLPFLHSPLPNGSRQLANRQFEAAKRAYNKQDYLYAEKFARQASMNAPESAAPWVLLGHCRYLQGQNQAALAFYDQALRINPTIGHLPPFVERLRARAANIPQTPPNLGTGDLASLRKKIGQMIMVSVPGTELSGQKRAMLRAGWIGGVILFNQNIQSKRQITDYVANLQANAPTPLFVAVDQEGGAVRRFREAQGFQTLPSQGALGRTGNTRLAYRFGLLSGRQLKDVGANLNLAPVVDIDYGIPNSVISKYHRSLGRDPVLISQMADEIVRGMRQQSVIATAKHFPTQSITTTNPHDEISTTDVSLSDLEKSDFMPYRSLIQANLLDSVMLSHVVYRKVDPDFPASLSPKMIQTYLRGYLGYKGLVISDDLRMDAVKQRFPMEVSVVQAVNSGVDILLVTDNFERRVMDILVNAVASGKVSQRAIDEAFNRIMATKSKYGILALKPARPAPNLSVASGHPVTPTLSPSSIRLAQKPPDSRTFQAQ